MAEIISISTNELSYGVGLSQGWSRLEQDMREGRSKIQQHTTLLDDVSRNGIVNPLIVTSDKKVLIGNQRLLVAKVLDIDNLPCVVVDPKEGYAIKVDMYKETEYDRAKF